MIFRSSSDGRVFTEYASSCLVNKQIMKDNQIKSQNSYRRFLQENAEKIMEINKQNASASINRNVFITN